MHRSLSPSALRHHSRPRYLAKCVPTIQSNLYHRTKLSRDFRQNREQTTHFHHQTHHVPHSKAITWCQKALFSGDDRHRIPVLDRLCRQTLPHHPERRKFSFSRHRKIRSHSNSDPNFHHSNAIHIRLRSFYAIYIRYNIA